MILGRTIRSLANEIYSKIRIYLIGTFSKVFTSISINEWKVFGLFLFFTIF